MTVTDDVVLQKSVVEALDFASRTEQRIYVDVENLFCQCKICSSKEPND